MDKAQRLFLLAMGIGLVPVALSYGALPDKSLPWLYGLSDPDLTMQHLFRAIMGLYLGMIIFWLAGAVRADLRMPALWSVFVFVTGIALGRVLSLFLDGWPQPLLIFYLLAEIILAGTSFYLITRAPNSKNARNA
ncbi:DUF4345 domain-containing protein [Pseudovibrio exalbescens]|uniref:DUF4345 domain-containing protein n=1 Tax=Pseudovibrio exalbescens TaxID=197461 RepID=UPI002365D8AD|nr:DUF4345 domain-containing protein [Pseudovibrio exalbescens]MDD7909997.1 DUF4345 domain-containing protein [Pseudovibrio exalbescens]